MSVVSRLVSGSVPGTRTPLSVLFPPYHASHGSCDTICLLCKGPPSTSWPSGSLCAHCLCQLRLQGEASLTILSTCPQKVPLAGVPPTHPEASQCNRKREAGTATLEFPTFLQKWASGSGHWLTHSLSWNTCAPFHPAWFPRRGIRKTPFLQESLSSFMDEEKKLLQKVEPFQS